MSSTAEPLASGIEHGLLAWESQLQVRHTTLAGVAVLLLSVVGNVDGYM